MFAVIRTGGKQYRVAPGDKIVVEKLAGSAGDSIDLTDVLLAGEGSDLKSTARTISPRTACGATPYTPQSSQKRSTEIVRSPRS